MANSIQAELGALWSCDLGEIRVTGEGQPSVFDMIRVLGGQKNPRQVWERLIATHPEVVTKTDNLKFPGRGQRLTPVAAAKEDAYYILGLLPGAVGRQYREHAASLFSRFLRDPTAVAAAAVERMSEKDAEWLEARLNGKRTRYGLGDDLKAHGVEGVGYARCTNAIYEPVLGADAKTMKQEIALVKNLPLKKVNPRDHMNIQQLTDLEFAERVASGQLKASSAYGNTQAERVCRCSAEFTRKLLDGTITIPGL